MSVALLTLLIALAIFGYGLTSRKNEQLAITPAMLFTLLGLFLSSAHTTTVQLNDHALMLLAELTLALILFTDASQIERSHLVRFEILPIRLLGLGLPLTVAAGTAAAVLLFAGTALQSALLPALLLALLLAPTDAALAQSIFGNQAIPEPLRHSITVESGLNDGLVLPLLLFVLALLEAAAGADTGLSHAHWLGFMALQFGIGIGTGLLTGRLGGWLVEQASLKQWMTPLYQRLAAPALALLAYSGAETLGGNGFIAVFLAGLFLRSHHTRVRRRLKEFGEAEGQLLSALVFVLFGLLFVPAALPYLSLPVVLYALLSLTLVRLVPVLIALMGTHLSWPARLFLAWFGPRGIASILYLMLVADQIDLQQSSAWQTLFATVVTTVLLSIFLHGLSARLFRHIRW